MVLIFLGIIYLPGFIKIIKLYNHKRELEKEIVRIRQENKQLREEIYKLQHDPTYIEKIAREELKLGKEGEIVYKIPSQKE